MVEFEGLWVSGKWSFELWGSLAVRVGVIARTHTHTHTPERDQPVRAFFQPKPELNPKD